MGVNTQRGLKGQRTGISSFFQALDLVKYVVNFCLFPANICFYVWDKHFVFVFVCTVHYIMQFEFICVNSDVIIHCFFNQLSIS